MSVTRIATIMLFSALLLHGCVVVDDNGRRRNDNRVAACGGGHRLSIVSLRMSPDPIARGQRIDGWTVGVRADAGGECRTTIRIRDDGDNETVGRESVFRLRPGMNQITVEPDGRYRLRRGEHCFTVLADIAGTPRQVDAARRFCAREARNRWTMQ